MVEIVWESRPSVHGPGAVVKLMFGLEIDMLVA